MSSNYNQISKQAVCIQTSNRTLAFYPKIDRVPVERFNEIIDGKIKILLKDFTAGKGDRSTDATYNLDLKDIYYLYNRARMFFMPSPFTGTKIIGSERESSGPFAGLSPVFHISIKREDQAWNKASNQWEPKKSPWNITIENGYSRAVNGRIRGTYYEDSKSFRPTATCYINLSDADFLMCMETLYKCIEEYRHLYSKELLPAGNAAMEEKVRRNQYDSPAAGQPYDGAYGQVPNGYAQPAADQGYGQDISAPVYVEQPASDPQPVIHELPFLICSDFTALDGNRAAAQCMINGETYTVVFDQVTQDLVESKTNQYVIKGSFYTNNGDPTLHCRELIAS